MGAVAVTAPDGTAGTIDQSELKEATAHGYKLAEAPLPAGQVLPPIHEAPETPGDPDTAAKGFSLPVMLRDKASGEARPVDPNDVPKLLASGSHEVADPKAQIQVVSPDGQIGTIDASELHDSLIRGGFHLPTDTELQGQGIREAAHENLGAGSAALLGLGAPMQGVVEAVGQRTGLLPEDLSAVHQAAEAAKEEHPAAYWASRVAGEVAGAYATGEVARAASIGAGATGYAKAALEGAIYAAEPAAAAVINKDPQGAAEALALGVAGNIGLHAVFSLGSNLVGKVAEGVASRGSEVAGAEERRVAENTVLKKLGVPASKVEEARSQLPSLLEATGIMAKDTEASALKKITTLEESGPRIGNAIKELDTVEGRDELVRNALMKSRQQIEEQVGKYVGPQQEQAVRALDDIHKQMAALITEGKTTFADTQGLKKFISEQTNFGDSKLANNLRQDAYSIVRNNVAEAENEAAQKVGGSAVFEALKADRALYTLHKFFGDYAERKAGQEVSESALGHFHVARHGLAAMAGHLIGLPAPVSVALSVGEMALRKGAKGRVFGDAVKVLQGSSTPNTSMALDAIRALDERIGTGARDLLKSLSAGEVAKHASVIDDTIGRFLPKGGVGQTRMQQISALRTAVNQHQDNPAGVADHLGNITAPLHEEGLQPVAEAYTQHQLRLMKVIQAILPQDPTMTKAHPFVANVAPEDISPATHARINRALTVASNPDALLGFVKANTIAPIDVAIAAATNPSTLQKMRNALVDEALKSKPDLSYQQRLSMSIMMGQNIDESTAQLPVLQGAFAMPPAAGSTGIPGGKAPVLKGGASEELPKAFLPDSAKGIVSASKT